MTKLTAPELLSPAGTLRNMRYAYAYGADAVYAGQPRYSLRVRNNDFTHDNLALGIEEAHKQGKQFYVAANIAPHNPKVRTFYRDIEPIIDMSPDALIMSDPGLIMMIRERWPEQAVHLSVQSNVVNYAAAKFWHKQGIERIIMSRELSLDEIEDVRNECPELELEVFVHGALCIAYSGRCLLSGYMNRRDPNQGTCTNACRWGYQAHEAKEDDSGDLVPVEAGIWTPPADKIAGSHDQEAVTLGVGAPTSKTFLLEEATRPGELMPAFEDEHGTYIMNSKDLRAVEHVERLTKMGVHSLKIEGRTKSHYYVARTAQAYRRAIDDAVAGRSFDPSLLGELDNLANRGYTEGFYRRHTHDAYQNYDTGNSKATQQQFVAEVLDQPAANKLTVAVKNRFQVGDELELMTPKGNKRFALKDLYSKKQKGSTDVAPGSGHEMIITLDEDVKADEFSLLMRNF